MPDIGAALLDAVGKIDARLDRMEDRLVKLEATSASTLDRVSDLIGRVAAFPDMHYLAAAAKAQLDRPGI